MPWPSHVPKSQFFASVGGGLRGPDRVTSISALHHDAGYGQVKFSNGLHGKRFRLTDFLQAIISARRWIGLNGCKRICVNIARFAMKCFNRRFSLYWAPKRSTSKTAGAFFSSLGATEYGNTYSCEEIKVPRKTGRRTQDCDPVDEGQDRRS
ncbi:hypothetical protein Mal52_48430 [Symmachiella dynata]|uniref:Uncharacterized protein n=1 Tax=Symmachiella dynata TaxID=2527995 RepID=A0A517ZV06_9PLAN|nr:hypothetical protein Mal52_48430 [Symmachiella dynata]